MLRRTNTRVVTVREPHGLLIAVPGPPLLVPAARDLRWHVGSPDGVSTSFWPHFTNLSLIGQHDTVAPGPGNTGEHKAQVTVRVADIRLMPAGPEGAPTH